MYAHEFVGNLECPGFRDFLNICQSPNRTGSALSDNVKGESVAKKARSRSIQLHARNIEKHCSGEHVSQENHTIHRQPFCYTRLVRWISECSFRVTYLGCMTRGLSRETPYVIEYAMCVSCTTCPAPKILFF